jgi:large subunit ribosomal protein L4
MWVGGGVSHGPRNEKDYSVKINKKVRSKALACVLSKKLVDGEIILVHSLSFSEPKSAEAKVILGAVAKGTGNTTLATKRKNAALVILPSRNIAVEKSFRNFGNIEVMMAKDINPVDLLTYKFVVIAEPKVALEVIEKRVSVVALKK